VCVVDVGATLYAALLLPGNLQRLANAVGWNKLGDPDDAEAFVEWTYLRDLRDGHREPEKRRGTILMMLQPSKRNWLEGCSIEEFNEFFGAVPRASATDIQSPGTWSISRFAPNNQ
jgi:hypothetical protein